VLSTFVDPGPASQPVFTRISLSAGNVVIEWSGGETLESADVVTGPWAAVAGASSPFTVTPTGNRFYRLRR
jgi:hypothetical protein